MKRSRTGSRRASALIVAVAVLSVLALLAVSLARLMVVEREATRSHKDKVHARFAAESGVEDTTARLATQLATKPDLAWSDGFVYRGERGVPIHEAPTVSFQAGATLGYPYSGVLPAPPNEAGRYATNGFHYAVQVLDLSSLISIRRFEAGNQGNALLLNNLGRRLKADGKFAVLDGTLGDKLALNQPAGGYGTVQEAWQVIRAQYGSTPALVADLGRLEDYVTVHGWVDPTTARAGGTVVARVAGQADPRAAHPIGLNTAPEEVLFALFAGVSATWIDADGRPVVHAVSDASAANLATFIANQRSGGRTYRNQNDVESLLVEATKATGYGIGVRDAIVLAAMLNPNAKLGRFNPDARLRFLSSDAGAKLGFVAKADRTEGRRLAADKGNLTRWTAEAAFDSAGRFRIRSLGRLVGTDGAILAMHEVEAVVKVADRATWTSQEEFEDLISAGGESRFVRSYPESLPANGASHAANPVTGGLALDAPASTPGGTRLVAMRPGDGKAVTPAGHDVSSAPWNPIRTGSLVAGQGDRASDGFLADPARDRVLAYDGRKLAVDKGTGEFWVKFTEQGLRSSGGLLWATNDLGQGPGASEHKGIHTEAYYVYDPTTRTGQIRIARTFFFFRQGVPTSGKASGFKRNLTGELKPNAHEILVQKGREIFDANDENYKTYWDTEGSGSFNQYRETFAQWYAERMLQAIIGGRVDQNEIVLTHNVVDKMGGGVAPT